MIIKDYLSYFKSLAKKIKNKVKGKINFYKTVFVNENPNFKTVLNEEGLIYCQWYLDRTNSNKLKNPRIYCLGIRMFDITTSQSGPNSTCVMKEIQINKFLHQAIIQPPISNGLLFFELGYRDSKGKWKKIIHSTLNLGLRPNLEKLNDDSWFYLSPSSNDIPDSLHERIYKLSEPNEHGGSESVQKQFKSRGIGGSEQINNKK